jgi:hypothetical protein
MGSITSDVQGTNSSDAVSYTFSEVTTNTLMTDTIFKNLGVKINEERVRRGSTANNDIKDEADFASTIQYAEMEKLRSSLVVTGSNPPTYEGKADGSLITFSSGTNTPPTFTFTQAGSSFADNPGAISAAGTWTGKPKITAGLFNSLIKGLKEQGAECVCNCNYCTCNCNYCTCNCNYACTCNCNY